MERQKRDFSAFDRLNDATQCVDKERKFLDALASTEGAGRIVNRIISLMTLFDGQAYAVPAYLHAHASSLFSYKPDRVAYILSVMIGEIVREARLSA